MFNTELQGAYLQDALNKYTGIYAVEQGLSPASKKNRRNFFLKFQRFLGDKPFNLHTARDFISTLRISKSGKPASTASILQYTKALSAFCQFLVNEELLDQNFCKKIKRPPNEQRDIKLISEEDAYKVIIAGTTPGTGDRTPSINKKRETRAALLFILSSGRRVSETLRMRGTDLHLHDDPPYYEVTQKGRRKPQPFECPPNMLEELRCRENNGKVFDTSADACNKALERGLTKLGIKRDITVHRLRDIFSVTRLRNDVPLQKVSRLLGHKNSLITDEYYSDFIMTDLSEGLRTSKLINQGQSVHQIFNNIEKAVNKAADDDRFLVETTRQGDEIIIRVTPKQI